MLIRILLAAMCFLTVGAHAEESPNVIIIISDDAGYADFGFTGCTDWATPNIDRLAAEGVIFEQGYVSASVCSPSRAGLITGCYQQRFGHEFNLGGAGRELGLDPDARTIADAMREQGYATGAIGKWHLGQSAAYRPLSRGFDEFYGYLGGSRSYRPIDEPSQTHRPMRNDAFEQDPPDSYVTHTLGKEAADFLDRHSDEPSFLYVAFTAVHTPMHATEDDLDQVDSGIKPAKRRTLAAMTRALDDAVGTILDAADRQIRPSLVFFINDNGGATTNASENGMFRGMKGSKFEGGVRVPFVMRWRGRVTAGSRYLAPVSSLDVFPTCLAASGAEPAAWSGVDGVNLLPFVDGERDGPPHEMLFWRRGVAAAVRSGDYKLIRVETNPLMLFNIREDPGETTNIADQHRVLVLQLTRSLEVWESGLAEPLWHEGEVWTQNQIKKHREDVRTRDDERRLPD